MPSPRAKQPLRNFRDKATLGFTAARLRACRPDTLPIRMSSIDLSFKNNKTENLKITLYIFFSWYEKLRKDIVIDKFNVEREHINFDISHISTILSLSRDNTYKFSRSHT